MSSPLERPVPLVVPERACGLRAAVSALWILKPGRVNPRVNPLPEDLVAFGPHPADLSVVLCHTKAHRQPSPLKADQELVSLG